MTGGRTGGFARIAGLAAAFSTVAGQAWAGTCALPDEEAALDTRVLQSELVVAALSCQQNDRYNAFVTKFSAALVYEGVNFRNFFTRNYGPYGEAMMDQLVTRLANLAEMRSWGLGELYCPTEASVFDGLLALDPSQLPAFAASRPYVNDHDVEPCPPQYQAATQQVPPEPAPASTPASTPAP